MVVIKIDKQKYKITITLFDQLQRQNVVARFQCGYLQGYPFWNQNEKVKVTQW